MHRVLVRTASRRRILPALALAALAGCAGPRPTTTAPAASYDPQRALLPLERIGAVDRPAASATTRPVIPLLARRYYQAGRDRFDEELWGEAIHELSRALQVQPDFVEARILMARAALLQGNTALGRTHAEEALRLAADDPAAHLLLGDLAWRASDLPGVIAHLRRALLCPGAEADGPETVVCHALLGLALKEEGYLAASADVLERFLGAVEKPGRHLRQHPELRQVMALYRSRAAREIGEIREQLGQVDAAIAAYRRGLGLFPDDLDLQRRLARALARAGRFDEAIELARQTCLRDEDHAAGLALLTSLEELGAGRPRIDDELIRLGSAAARPALLARVAQRLGERGRTSEAAAVLRRLVDLQPDEPDARLQLAAELAALRDYDGCLDHLVEVLQRRGDAYERVCGELARIVSAGLDRAALIERARAGAAKRAALKPILGRLLLLDGRSDEAASVLTDAVEADPTLGAAHAMLAEIKLERRLWEPALKSADAAIEAGVRDAAVYRVRGTACEALDDLPKAEAAFSAAIRLDRRDTASMMALVGLLDRRGETRRAIQLLEDLVARADPSHVEARESLIRAYLSAQDLKAARKHYSEMRRLEAPRQALRRVEALVTLVTDSSKPGNARLEQYRRTLRELIRDDPKDVESAMDLALSYVAGRDFEPALPVVESALGVRPDFARAAELRITLLARTLEFEKAITSLQSLLRDRPRHSGYLMQMGSLALDAGDYPLAIETYRKLLGREDLSGRFMQFRRELVAAFAGRQEYSAGSRCANRRFETSRRMGAGGP